MTKLFCQQCGSTVEFAETLTMIICGGCGELYEIKRSGGKCHLSCASADGQPPPEDQKSLLMCPGCSSADTAAISIEIERGTIRGSANSTTIGVGGSNRGGVAVGMAGTNAKTISMTDFAAKYSIGPKPAAVGEEENTLFASFVVSVAGVLAILFALHFSAYWWAAFFSLITPFGARLSYLSARSKSARAARSLAEWDAKKSYIESAWVCHRCGHDWIPTR